MDDFYAARSSTAPPLPWPNFAPPFSPERRLGTARSERGPTGLLTARAAMSAPPKASFAQWTLWFDARSKLHRKPRIGSCGSRGNRLPISLGRGGILNLPASGAAQSARPNNRLHGARRRPGNDRRRRRLNANIDRQSGNAIARPSRQRENCHGAKKAAGAGQRSQQTSR